MQDIEIYSKSGDIILQGDFNAYTGTEPDFIQSDDSPFANDADSHYVSDVKVSKVAKIRNRYNQVPHLTQDTNGKVTNSQKTPQTRAKRSALSQQVTTKHI